MPVPNARPFGATTMTVLFWTAAALFSWSVPPVTAMSPVYGLAAESTNVPEPLTLTG